MNSFISHKFELSSWSGLDDNDEYNVLSNCFVGGENDIENEWLKYRSNMFVIKMKFIARR